MIFAFPSLTAVREICLSRYISTSLLINFVIPISVSLRREIYIKIPSTTQGKWRSELERIEDGWMKREVNQRPKMEAQRPRNEDQRQKTGGGGGGVGGI